MRRSVQPIKGILSAFTAVATAAAAAAAWFSHQQRTLRSRSQKNHTRPACPLCSPTLLATTENGPNTQLGGLKSVC